MKSVVVVHKDYGVFLGYILGEQIWSKIDCHGIDLAYTFHSKAEAMEFIAMTSLGDIKELELRKVDVDNVKEGATVENLKAAGLDGYIHMLSDAKLWAAPGGRA